MDNYLLQLIENYSIRIIIVAIISIISTHFVKIPIKNITSKLNEDSRKMVNFIILIIPLIVSFFTMCVIWVGFQNIWSFVQIFNETVKSWLLALSLYSISSRIWLLILGVINGEISFNSKIAKEIISNVKEDITNIEKNIGKDGTFSDIVEGIDKIFNINEVEEINHKKDIEEISKVNVEISEQQKETKQLDFKITSKKFEIKNKEKE